MFFWKRLPFSFSPEFHAKKTIWGAILNLAGKPGNPHDGPEYAEKCSLAPDRDLAFAEFSGGSPLPGTS